MQMIESVKKPRNASKKFSKLSVLDHLSSIWRVRRSEFTQNFFFISCVHNQCFICLFYDGPLSTREILDPKKGGALRGRVYLRKTNPYLSVFRTVFIKSKVRRKQTTTKKNFEWLGRGSNRIKKEYFTSTSFCNRNSRL